MNATDPLTVGFNAIRAENDALTLDQRIALDRRVSERFKGHERDHQAWAKGFAAGVAWSLVLALVITAIVFATR